MQRPKGNQLMCAFLLLLLLLSLWEIVSQRQYPCILSWSRDFSIPVWSLAKHHSWRFPLEKKWQLVENLTLTAVGACARQVRGILLRQKAHAETREPNQARVKWYNWLWDNSSNRMVSPRKSMTSQLHSRKTSQCPTLKTGEKDIRLVIPLLEGTCVSP